MNRVNSSVSVQQFFVVQSNQKALFETPQGQSYECLTVPSTAAAVEVSSGDIILQLDDISVEANTLSKWLIDHKNVADNQIWAASRMHPESSKGKDYVLGLGAMLLNLLARLFFGYRLPRCSTWLSTIPGSSCQIIVPQSNSE
jgi:hypothetical protein